MMNECCAACCTRVHQQPCQGDQQGAAEGRQQEWVDLEAQSLPGHANLATHATHDARGSSGNPESRARNCSGPLGSALTGQRQRRAEDICGGKMKMKMARRATPRSVVREGAGVGA